MSRTSELVFRLPDTTESTDRLVTCDCIRGPVAKEIQTLWEAYRIGYAGLNPAAYREVVEMLTATTSLLNEGIPAHRTEYNAVVEQARQTLARAQGTG